MTKYLLDTSVLVPANRTYYDLTFCPAFWEWLITASIAGAVASIDQVSDQIKAQDYELSQWISAKAPRLIVPTDQKTLILVSEVSDHVNAGVRHTDAAKAAFNASVYPFLIAYARAHNCTVVTLEQSARNIRDVIKLPDVCIDLGVECIDTFEMLRRESPSFVLA